VIQSLRRELQLREAQLLATSSTIAELHNELDKTCQREVAAVERARNLFDQVERVRSEMEQQASSMPRPSELQALQYELGEKDAQLKALLEEGNALSVKQSQYEQRLRVLRKEKDEEEERRLKFQTQSEAMSVQAQDLAARLKIAEDEGKTLAKEVRELQSNAQSTQKKLSKAEQDASAAMSQLESAQAQVKSLSDDNKAMKSQLDALKGTSQSHEVLTVEKQEMQRTIDYLQHSIRELEEDSQRREESSRTEIQSMKKKWLDAVARVDMMGQSVSEATQPLLQQINALREELRARQDGWKATETTLLARIEDNNELRLALEREKLEAVRQVHSLQVKIDALKSENLTKQVELAREKERLEIALQEARELRGQMDATRIELDETKVKLDNETHAKQQLMTRVNADRLKKRELPDRSDSTGGTESSNLELVEARQREAQLRVELERSQSELAEVKTLLEANGVASRSHRGLSTSSRDGSSHEPGEVDAPGSSNSSLVTQASILKSTLESPADNSAMFGANTTVLGLSQLQQRLRLMEGEKRMLKQQLTALEAKQKQNTDDIVRLSTRNALLETKETELHQAQQELVQLKQRQQVLLELFGEKEEQVEELQAEVGELKAFYRKQLDTLAGQQR
jgi:chromosome segregation ATPase